MLHLMITFQTRSAAFVLISFLDFFFSLDFLFSFQYVLVLLFFLSHIIYLKSIYRVLSVGE